MNFFTAILKYVCPFWTFLESEMTDFPTFHILQQVKSVRYHFIYLKPA